jgi:hypothetical protein
MLSVELLISNMWLKPGNNIAGCTDQKWKESSQTIEVIKKRSARLFGKF